jgi:tyrosine-protein kinase Etk/Wzc
MRVERLRPPSEPGREPDGGGGNDFDLMSLLTQLWVRKWLVLGLTLIGAAIGAAVGQLPPNQFRTTALVQIEPMSGGITLPTELIGELLLGRDQANSLETETHVIRSRLILDAVIDDLRLDIVVIPQQAPFVGEVLMRRHLPVIDGLLAPAYARANERLVVDDFAPPPGVDRVSLLVLDGGRIRATLPDGATVEGAVPGTLDLPGGGTLGVTRLEAPAGRVYTVARRPHRLAANEIRAALTVRPRGFTGIVDFTLTGTSRDNIIGILNAVIDNYQDQNLRRRSAEIDQSIVFIESQLPEIRTQLAQASEALQRFRRERQQDELSLGTQDLLRRILEIETRLEEIAFGKEQALRRVTENHPDYRALISEEELLRGRLDNLRRDLAEVPEAERELATLVEQAERTQQLEIQLSGRIEQLRVLRASTVSNIRILERAEAAPHIGPDRRRPIALGALAGFVLAAIWLYARNYLRRGIDDTRAIEQLGLSLFATIEKVPALSAVKASDPRYGVVLNDQNGTAAEAFRSLRTGMRFSLAAAGAKSLMITSCAPGDGKSFVSLNLALVSGQAGTRVLLIDADMRRGFLRQYFGLPRNGPGLSDLLAGESDLDRLLHRHEASGIDFLPSGRYPPNPAELLAGPLFRKFLDYAQDSYDLVIVDAPPVLSVTDPAIIGQHVGMSLLVVRHLVTTQPEIQLAARALSNTGIALSGVVLNQFDLRGSRYGSYGTRYGYYAGGYAYKAD